MNKISDINSILSQKKVALVGYSRKEKSFSRNVFDHLSESGYEIYAVNPSAGSIQGNTVYKNILDIPYKVDAALMMTPKAETFGAVKDAVRKGVKYIWIQQNSETNEAIDFCRENNVNLVSGKCILMFCEPVKNIHRFHRFISKLTGGYPKDI